MRIMKYKSIILTHPFVSYAPSFLSENESVIEAACFFYIMHQPHQNNMPAAPCASPHAASFF